jgi:psp operon transcriptional activator
MDKKISIPEALGQSEAFINFQEQISKVAPVERPVLILGERGTGKELAASRIHFLSQRWQKAFITLNCSALTPALIGSELFGYEKGAFTGAASRQQGRFEKASQGTLFLDEIGTIPMEVQEKILRVVEYGNFERVGSSQSIHVDVRIVAATNIDLASAANSGEFKQDLLDRLSFEVIYVPPLRSRKEDIIILAHHFAARMAFELGRHEIPEISSKALSILESYPWPGNVRELKNVIERAVYKSSSNKIFKISFDPFNDPYKSMLGNSQTFKQKSINKKISEDNTRKHDYHSQAVLDKILKLPLKKAVKELEQHMVQDALKKSQHNQKKAAKILGLSYDQFRGIKKKYGQGEL